MGAIAIKITIKDLIEIGKAIFDILKRIVEIYTSIKAASQDLHVEYKGKASDTFNERIEGYQNDFDMVQTTLQNFGDFVSDYKTDLERLEQELAEKAGKLSVGK